MPLKLRPRAFDYRNISGSLIPNKNSVDSLLFLSKIATDPNDTFDIFDNLSFLKILMKIFFLETNHL